MSSQDQTGKSDQTPVSGSLPKKMFYFKTIEISENCERTSIDSNCGFDSEKFNKAFDQVLKAKEIMAKKTIPDFTHLSITEYARLWDGAALMFLVLKSGSKRKLMKNIELNFR